MKKWLNLVKMVHTLDQDILFPVNLDIALSRLSARISYEPRDGIWSWHGSGALDSEISGRLHLQLDRALNKSGYITS